MYLFHSRATRVAKYMRWKKRRTDTINSPNTLKALDQRNASSVASSDSRRESVQQGSTRGLRATCAHTRIPMCTADWMELRSNHNTSTSNQQQQPPIYHAFRTAKNRPTNVEPPAAAWDSRAVSSNPQRIPQAACSAPHPARRWEHSAPQPSNERGWRIAGYSHRWYIIHSNSCPTAADPYEQHTSQQPSLHRQAGIGARDQMVLSRAARVTSSAGSGAKIQGVH